MTLYISQLDNNGKIPNQYTKNHYVWLIKLLDKPRSVTELSHLCKFTAGKIRYDLREMASLGLAKSKGLYPIVWEKI